MRDGGAELAYRRQSGDACELSLGSPQRLLGAFAMGNVAADVSDVYGLPGLWIIDPECRIQHRDSLASLEVAKPNFSRRGSFFHHRWPQYLVHEWSIFGKHVVQSPSHLSLFPVVEPNHVQSSLVQIDRRSVEIRYCHE